jgi:hypothetical protein
VLRCPCILFDAAHPCVLPCLRELGVQSPRWLSVLVFLHACDPVSGCVVVCIAACCVALLSSAACTYVISCSKVATRPVVGVGTHGVCTHLFLDLSYAVLVLCLVLRLSQSLHRSAI